MTDATNDLGLLACTRQPTCPAMVHLRDCLRMELRGGARHELA